MLAQDDLNIWDTVLLRLTAFVDNPDYAAASDWWKNVVGSDAEEKREQSKPKVHEYRGEFENNDLSLIIQSIRVDWVYSGVDTPERLQPLGSFGTQSALFAELLDSWFKLVDCPSMSRLALGVILHHSVDNPLAGYELLKSKYIPFNFRFDEKTSDFLYQINRRRQSQIIEKMEINRLMKWSVNTRNFLLLSPIQKQFPPTYSVRLELDINSSVDFENDILPRQAKSLLEEFVGLGKEIMQKGDMV